MAAVSLDYHKAKDPVDWTPKDVHEFLGTILPGHPCVDYFTYTSGRVLCDLEKEDLRRQARSDEAANVIWAELKLLRRGPEPGGGGGGAPRGERELLGGPNISVYLHKREEVAIEFDVHPSTMVGELKVLVAEREGTAVENQRLIVGGMNMQDDRTLASYDVRNGGHILIVPHLRDQQGGGAGGTGRPRAAVFTPPRGLLMVPGSAPWQAGHPARPYLPVVCSSGGGGGAADRGGPPPFPVSMEFESAEDYESFTAAAREAPPLLRIEAGKQRPEEARAFLDPDTGGVQLDATGAFLEPGMRYTAVAHLGGGRGGQVSVVLEAGNAAA